MIHELTAEYPDGQKITVHAKCALCGRSKGWHKAETMACPVSRFSVQGKGKFHRTNKFTAK
jgi:hypothetical protein